MASIRKRGKNFTITVYMGYDQNGKQRRKTTTFRSPDNCSDKKAEKLAIHFAHVWENKIHGYRELDENQTLTDLITWYFECIAPCKLKPWILKNNYSALQNHIIPFIGFQRLKYITPLLLEAFFNNLLRGGNKKVSLRLINPAVLNSVTRTKLASDAGVSVSTVYTLLRGGCVGLSSASKISGALHTTLGALFTDTSETHGLSASSINKLKNNLSAVFQAAVFHDILTKNPCRQVMSFREDYPKRLYLSKNECTLLVTLLKEQPDREFELIILTLLTTGIRSGELLALHWEDFDSNTSSIYIRHTLTRSGGVWHREDPKTKGSYRRIVLPAKLTSLLVNYRNTSLCEQTSLNSPIFTNLKGSYLHGSSINAKLKQLIKNTPLPQNLHLHSLRHTHASLLIDANIPARIVADRLGHTSTKTTLDIYGHVYREKESLTANVISALLFS